MIRVAVAGAAGRMGQTVCSAVEAAPDMELVGRADPLLGKSLEQVLAEARPEVVVDFTRPDTAIENAVACVRAGAHVVIGTTGFDIDALTARTREIEGARGGEVEVSPATAAARRTCSSPPTSRSARS